MSYNYFRILINFYLRHHLSSVHKIGFTTDRFYLLSKSNHMLMPAEINDSDTKRIEKLTLVFVSTNIQNRFNNFVTGSRFRCSSSRIRFFYHQH